MKSEEIFLFYKRHCSTRGTHDYNLRRPKKFTIFIGILPGYIGEGL